MSPSPPRPITDDEIETCRRDGIVVLRGLFDRSWIEHLGPLVDADMAAPGPLHQELEKREGGGRFFFDTLRGRHPSRHVSREVAT